MDGRRIVRGVDETDVIFGQVVGGDNPLEQVVELLQRTFTAGLVVQHAHPARPARRLVAGVLAGDPIDGALNTAGEGEVVGVQRQQRPVLDDPFIDPVGQGEGQAFRGAGDRVRLQHPFVEPAELRLGVALGPPDRGLDRRGLQPLKSGLEFPIALAAGVALDRLEEIVGRGVQGPGQVVLAGLPHLVDA